MDIGNGVDECMHSSEEVECYKMMVLYMHRWSDLARSKPGIDCPFIIPAHLQPF